MKKQIAIAAAVFAVASTFGTRGAGAQSRETVTTSRPNRALLYNGLVALGAPYVASVTVAATSDYSVDRNLYAPVVGPWFDLGARGSCGGTGQTTCGTQTAYEFLLVSDGILQGIGALAIVGSFALPATAPMTVDATERRVVFSPARMGPAGYGVAAVGSF